MTGHAVLEPRQCPACGATFQPRVPWAVYCSRNCQKRMHRRRLVARRKAAGLCPQCGGELTAVPRVGGYWDNGAEISYCAKCRSYFAARWRKAHDAS